MKSWIFIFFLQVQSECKKGFHDVSTTTTENCIEDLPHCPPGWQAYNGSCLRVKCNWTALSYNDAWKACQALGATSGATWNAEPPAWTDNKFYGIIRFAVIQDDTMNTQVYTMARNQYTGPIDTWIGGADEYVEGSWLDNGNPVDYLDSGNPGNGNPLKYTNWHALSPHTKDYDRNYIVMNAAPYSTYNGKWSDSSKDYNRHCYACELDKNECMTGAHSCPDICGRYPIGKCPKQCYNKFTSTYDSKFSCQYAHDFTDDGETDGEFEVDDSTAQSENTENDDDENDESPCPNEKCWTFDGHKCNLQPGYTELTCGATSISVGINKEVFGYSDTNQPISTTPELSVGDSGYELECKLGECGMEYEHTHDEDGTNKLVFRLKIKQNKSNGINLGDVSVSTGGNESGIDLEFVCIYDMDVTITSDEFTIKDAAISGTTTASGSLADGFSLAITSDKGFVLGTMLNVAASWELSFPDISFSFEECNVQQEGKSVTIIKDFCLAEVFDVSGMSTSESDISFGYRLFSIDETSSAQQIVFCKLNICLENCQKPTDGQCPKDGNDALYNFTVNGKIF